MTIVEKDFLSRLDSTRSTWQKWWDLLWDHSLYQISTILNPHHRTKWVRSVLKKENTSQGDIGEKLKSIKQIWLDWVEKYDKEQRLENASYDKQRERRRTVLNQIQGRTIDNLSARIFGDWTEVETSDEYEEYILEPVSEQQNSLEWWLHSVRQERWPRLSKFAVSILSFPPMSDEAERIFLGARRTISWERSRLTPDLIKAIECYHHILRQRIPDKKD